MYTLEYKIVMTFISLVGCYAIGILVEICLSTFLSFDVMDWNYQSVVITLSLLLFLVIAIWTDTYIWLLLGVTAITILTLII